MASVNLWIDLLTPVREAVAAAVGVVVTLGQLTITARWRRSAAYWREIAEMDGPQHDRETARRLSREALAKLTAVHLVPGRELLWAASIVVFSLLGVVLFSARPGNTPSEALTLGAFIRDAPLTFVALVALLVSSGHGVARWSDALHERRRLAQAYLQGKSLNRRPLGSSGGGQSREALGWRVTVMHVGIAAGLWCMALVYGLVWGATAQGASEAPELVSRILLAGTIFLGVSALTYQALPKRTPYEHPASGDIRETATPHAPTGASPAS